MYFLRAHGEHEGNLRVQLLGSGVILREVEAAAALLFDDFHVSSDIWSVTSFNELARDCQSITRARRLDPDSAATCHVETCLNDRLGPVVAATDYVKQYAEQIRSWVKSSYYVLGTDGYGRSDTRANLRKFFEVDRYHITLAALQGLHESGLIEKTIIWTAIEKYNIDTLKPIPWN